MFALIAIAANIGGQEIALQLYDEGAAVAVSVIVGTLVGLVVKYVLDKRYIFHFRANTHLQNTKTFVLYSITGIGTTAIFWGFEFGFQYLFETKEMRYLGGILGLLIGYFSKYQLDSRYVFRLTSR